MRSSRRRNVPEPRPSGLNADGSFKSLFLQKALPLFLIIGVVGGLLFWMMDEVDGEYLGASKDLGRLRLSLDKESNGLSGTLAFSGGIRLPIADGRMTGAHSFELTFANPDSKSDAGFQKAHHLSAWSNPTLIGQTDNGILKATFQNGEREYKLTLKRSPASVLFRRLWWQR